MIFLGYLHDPSSSAVPDGYKGVRHLDMDSARNASEFGITSDMPDPSILQQISYPSNKYGHSYLGTSILFDKWRVDGRIVVPRRAGADEPTRNDSPTVPWFKGSIF